MENQKLLVTSTPHIRSRESTFNIMLDVIFALIPAAIMAVYFYGFRALLIISVSVASAILSEALFQFITKRKLTIKDLSAVITGLLLAFNLPASVPIWIPIIGSCFAIIVVKQLFGGIGQNFMNPALGARAFLLAAYPIQMTDWSLEPTGVNIMVDGMTGATPLALLKNGFVPGMDDIFRAFTGNLNGSLGETCSAALLLGFAYLLVRKVISWRIPVTYIGTFAILAWVFGRNGAFTGNALFEVLTGGLILGAVYMATDYSTSPITAKGQIIMGVGCGILTAVIRIFGSYPEGVSYSILLMNLAVPLIDKLVKPRISREVRRSGGNNQNRA